MTCFFQMSQDFSTLAEVATFFCRTSNFECKIGDAVKLFFEDKGWKDLREARCINRFFGDEEIRGTGMRRNAPTQMTWSLSKKTIILPSTLMKCLWNVNVQVRRIHFSADFLLGRNRVKLWFIIAKHQDVSLAKQFAQNPWRSTSPKVRCFFRKKLKFSGHSCFLHPETLGKWSNFWGAYYSKGNLKSPTSFVHVFLRGNTRGKKSSLLKSVFKGDQVMAVQQQRQGPNGCGVLVATKLVLGVMYL